MFDASDDEDADEPEEEASPGGQERTAGRGHSLFGEEEEDEEEEADDFRIRSQYEGAKGQKVGGMTSIMCTNNLDLLNVQPPSDCVVGCSYSL